MNEEHDKEIDYWRVVPSTVLFVLETESHKPIGTGFVVSYPIGNDDNNWIPLFVTAKHVLCGRDSFALRFSTHDNTLKIIDFDMNELRRENRYWVHSDQGADIAVVAIEHFWETTYRVIPYKVILTETAFDYFDIKIADPIMYPGLLWQFMGSQRNYPVTRTGTIALIPEEPVPLKYECGDLEINTFQRVILLDAMSIGGASGAPVFLRPAWREIRGKENYNRVPALIGIMHGFYTNPRELLEIQVTDTVNFFSENTGIAIVFPSWRIIEIFESSPFLNFIETKTS